MFISRDSPMVAEPSAEVVSRTEYAFESRKLAQEEVRVCFTGDFGVSPAGEREFEGERASNFM